MAYSLELMTGARAGEKCKLAEGAAVVVGRTDKAQFQVADDATMSGAHFEVKAAAGKVTVRDVGSRAGTLIHGARIQEETEVKVGDRIQAGQSTFLLVEVPVFGSWTLKSTPERWEELPGQGYREPVSEGPFSSILFTEEAQDLDKSLSDYVADQKLIFSELRKEWTVGEAKTITFAGADEAIGLEIQVPAEGGRGGEIRQLYVRKEKRFGTATLTTGDDGVAEGRKVFEQTLRAAKFEPAAAEN